MTRPNILFIMTDEQRYPPPYEGDDLQAFRRTQLRAQARIRERATEFHRHYAASVACAPSRACLMTGHYPVLHGVRATDGAAKGARDADVYWLDPNSVPTMGHYFRAGGYRTFYRGKWHVSHADMIVPDTHASLASNDADGNILDQNTALYRAADRLGPFGFSGWIGPEPHGAVESNCGVVRDPLTSDQVIALLDELEAQDDDRPWLTVASFLNPHDIALSGIVWRRWGRDMTDDTVPKVPEPPTQDESLDTKPRCQADFVDKYRDVFIAQPQTGAYRRFYYYLHKLVDQQIERVLDRLAASRFGDDTIIVFTSDHGDMLGAHGGLHQKWHTAYDESWRVPLLIAGPGLPAGQRVDQPTSHVDLLPTMLSLAGVDAEAARQTLASTHSEAQPLVGRDLSPALRGEGLSPEPVYCMTEDEISEGLDETNARGQRYEPVEEPAKLEAIVTRLEPDGPLYKYARYYEASLIGGETSRKGKEDLELYDLDVDPTEVTNLAHRSHRNRETRRVAEQLGEILEQTRARKAPPPSNRTTP